MKKRCRPPASAARINLRLCLCLCLCLCLALGACKSGASPPATSPTAQPTASASVFDPIFYVGGEPVPILEFRYYYDNEIGTFFSSGEAEYYGVDSEKPLSEQQHPDYEMSWEEVIYYSVESQVCSIFSMYLDALANNYKLSDEASSFIDDYMLGLEEYSAQEGRSVLDVIQEQWGSEMTLEFLTGILNRQILGEDYSEYFRSQLSFTDQDLQDYYDENKDQAEGVPEVNTVSFRHFLMSDKDGALEAFEAFEAGDKSEDSFIEMMQAHGDEDSFGEDNGLYEGVLPVNTSDEFNDYEQWAFDPEREMGDYLLLTDTEYGSQFWFFLSQMEPVWKVWSRNSLEQAEVVELMGKYPLTPVEE